MKIWHKILLLVATLLIICGVFTYDAFYSAPSRFDVRYETLESIYIPAQLSDTTILFFSDLDYGDYMDEERLEKLVDTINRLAPDVVLFGGDLVSYQRENYNQDILISELKKIHAPLGKFAVLGDFDTETEEWSNQIQSILYQSDFELLNNQSMKLRNMGSESISIVGISDGIHTYQDISNAYANVPRTSYCITICHTPDTADLVPTDLTKYFLSGHSLGGQVYWFFGSYYHPEKVEKYFRGKHTIQGTFTLDISNGVGTLEKDVRFLSNPEIVLYRLQHTSLNDIAQ